MVSPAVDRAGHAEFEQTGRCRGVAVDLLASDQWPYGVLMYRAVSVDLDHDIAQAGFQVLVEGVGVIVRDLRCDVQLPARLDHAGDNSSVFPVSSLLLLDFEGSVSDVSGGPMLLPSLANCRFVAVFTDVRGAFRRSVVSWNMGGSGAIYSVGWFV
jgi:hypothetical protein